MISRDWRGGLVAPLAVILLAVWSEPTGAQQERVFYAGASGGWAVPTGSVSSLSDLISFPSVPARDLYKPGLAIGLMGGITIKGVARGRRHRLDARPTTDPELSRFTG